MSGLPIISPLNSAAVSLRSGPLVVMPNPSHVTTSAVVNPLTANAVQQSRAVDTIDAVPRKALAMAPDKRSRLVGPPPTFEVNLLQHLQETRMLKDVSESSAQAAPEPEARHPTPAPARGADEASGTRNSPDMITSAPGSAYQAQGEIQGKTAEALTTKMNISL